MDDPSFLSAITGRTTLLGLMVGSHQETIMFDLISYTQHLVILGLSWLVMHNPVVYQHRHFINLTYLISVDTPSVLVRSGDKYYTLSEVLDNDMSTPEFHSFSNIGTRHIKFQAAIEADSSSLIPQNIGSSLISLRNRMCIDFQTIGLMTIQLISLTVCVPHLDPFMGYKSQSWMQSVQTPIITWPRGSSAAQNLLPVHKENIWLQLANNQFTPALNNKLINNFCQQIISLHISYWSPS